MSDAEQSWKPNGRPQSTMAQAFSSVLDSAFSLDSDPGVSSLSSTIDEKRHQMMQQNRELEELQAKIRQAEERLKSQQSGVVDGNASRANEPHQDRGYQSGSTSSATSPTEMAGQYSHGDDQRMRSYGRS